MKRTVKSYVIDPSVWDTIFIEVDGKRVECKLETSLFRHGDRVKVSKTTKKDYTTYELTYADKKGHAECWVVNHLKGS